MLLFVVLVSAIYGAFVGRLRAGWRRRDQRARSAIRAGGCRVQRPRYRDADLGSRSSFGLLDRFTRRSVGRHARVLRAADDEGRNHGDDDRRVRDRRPYPVFREFLLYASQAQSPAYGAVVMALQGIGQVAIMVAAFC